ncbi:signal peptide peptidase SppA [Mycobacterium intracellulare]|uniref:signal peptide peptidase SppA n=1 Tax=Mycobacterium intracellulare TaxID=1767 RepID=UPI0004B37476|nr:signal peptide peptidase SppA [Mycobacterium intracellulare]AOS93630.1 signal peptide peptidase SppA [Mycobacterium intracellulare subsp. chimaera]ARV84082.1 signal peptide peptidase SppA [Mycobacterium intracellulare subsp. chimaera]ASL11383.1 signal peptide peptidase SppA, 67K type [Mycobacterium intracellulare subsp. chimaera]ASL23305.1 signal peptide peptidase SppA, 67K type [Mycobacterium intracellulare subsp. chimaera]KPN45693.1 signal peptide peptidase SppA [Mycobacterium intracellul
MFAFLPSIPGLSKGADEVRALADRVDTARHHGVPNGCVLELDLRSMPPETSGFDPLAMITGGSRPVSLRDTVSAIYRAAEDPRVAGLIARVQLTASPSAAVQELREAIVAFTAAKPSLAWAETYPGTLSYYLASAFGEVWMQPAGSVGLIGFASNATFLRDAFDKAGIEAEVVARGEYKSAANRFTEHGFTEAHREAVTRMLESIREQVWEAVGTSRKLDAAALDALADRAPLLREEAVSSGLVDRIGFRDEAYDRIAELVGVKDVSEENAPPRLYLSRYAGAARSRLIPPAPSVPGRRPKPTVAVINVDGTIVDGRGGPQFLPFGTSTVGSDTIAPALREAAADDSVSAIVVRVNSPGGSVTASETLWREVKKARKRGKPVVASMGSVAASGGYYVAVAADAVVASPATITGSIGVLTGKLVIRDLLGRLGVGSDTVRTNANADAWAIDAPFTPEQRAHREAEADLLYADFVERVAEGRNLTKDAVDRVARGRVWTGADALERGLVDELGGFRTALRRAKILAGLDEDADVRIVTYPGGSLLDMLRPRASSQPATASLPDALGALLGRTIGGIVDNVGRSVSGASALWAGPWRL